MAECSLCKEPLQPEGGAILFTDSRGKPFEVCGECEKRVDLLGRSSDEAEIQSALNYISERADNVEYRDTYDALFAFIKQENPEAAASQDEQAVEEPVESDEESAKSIEEEMEAVTSTVPESSPSTKRKFWFVAVGIVIFGLLVIVYVLGGFHIG